MTPRKSLARSGTGRVPLAVAAGLPLALALGLILAGCGSQAAPGDGMPPPPEVSVAPVLAKPVRHWDEFTGRVAAVESVELRPRVSGYVERVAYTEGQVVAKGDLLFVIDERRYRADLERAVAGLERARSEARLARSQTSRAEALVKAQAISREDFESRTATTSQAQAQVRAAEAEVARARLDLQFTQVRAPIGGRAGRALVTVGNLAQADTSVLTTLVSMDPVHVYFETDEQTYLRYNALARQGDRDRGNQPVRVGLANEEGYPHAGTVDFIDNRADAGTGTVRVRAVLPNPEHVFTPGLFARVQLEGARSAQALLVDDRAVLTDQDRKYVYVLGPDNQALRRDIAVGRQIDGLRVATSGLQPQDRVIVHGVQKVFFPGMPVSPTVIQMGAPAPAVAVAAK